MIPTGYSGSTPGTLAAAAATEATTLTHPLAAPPREFAAKASHNPMRALTAAPTAIAETQPTLALLETKPKATAAPATGPPATARGSTTPGTRSCRATNVA